MYISKLEGPTVKILKGPGGTLVSSINLTPYKGGTSSYMSEGYLVVQCGDGKTRVFKPSGTLIQSY